MMSINRDGGLQDGYVAMATALPRLLATAYVTMIAAAVGAALATVPNPDRVENDADLVHRTLIYRDAAANEHLIFFGQFANFDWYFPCRFETGSWSLDEDQTLHLSYDNPEYAPQAFRLAGLAPALTLTPPDGGAPTDAELVRGNKLPFG